MSEIIFLNKIYFLLLIPLIGFVIYIFFKKKNKIKFSFYEDIKKVYKHSNTYYYIFYVLLILIIIFYTIILANPNKTNTTEKVNKNWVDIVLAFDISYSMEATDLQPTRMDVARNVISSFLWNLKTDRVWIVVFSWKPFTSIPLTFDYNFLKDYVASLSPKTINQNNMNLQWTAIWDAMVMGSYLYDNKSKDREKVMIIVTDWEANKWLDPTTALKLLKDKKIKAYTVWIWWLEKTYTYVTDQFWNQLKAEIWWVDETTLKNIASETWWKYYRATSQTVFKEIFDEINKLEKKDIQVETKKVYDTRYEWFYYILLILQTCFILLLFKRIRV